MKKAVVLGGSRGIGKGISENLRKNYEVFSFSSKECDTSDLNHINKIVNDHPNVDILVLNTGGPPAINFFDIKLEDWHKYHNQLFLGFCTILQNIKINNGGYIFLISSFNIKEPNPNLILSNCYRIAFTSVLKSLSKIYGKNQVSCINIAPGPIETDRLNSLVEDIEALKDSIPINYIAKPDEIGRFVSSIIDNNIKYLTGVTINFDGGSSNFIL